MSDDGFTLSVTRMIDAPADAVWKVWTERLEEWWCPKPWTTELIEMDLRPGGRSAMIMRGPNAGEEHRIEGVFLEVIPARKVVFTDAYKVGWIPQTPFMTGVMEFHPEGDQTRYVGSARHWTEEAYKQHQEMGFEQGWGAVADQLAALVEPAAAF